MTHLAGKKFSKRHTTAIKSASQLGRFLTREPLVSKIIVGEIKPIRVGPKRLKIQPVEAGLKLTIRDTSARQTIYVYTKNQQKIEDLIQQFWTANCA
ncbi:MAG: hypothetical protein WCT26_05090 [Candidatus Buchananbacteria bacterium]|jgi:hypothetical protein